MPTDLSESPVCVWNDDRYFFDEDDLQDFIDEHGPVRLVHTELEPPPRFELQDWLQDYLPPDMEGDISNVVDDDINGLIQSVTPRVWRPINVRVG